jgi:hypothetical protein
MPDVRPTVAIVVLLLDHVPPAMALLSPVVRPVQIEALPVMAATGFTVMVEKTTQSEPSEYVITAVPGFIPVTMPVVNPVVAMEVAPLVQAPPETASLSIIKEPIQTLAAPDMGPGAGLTVTVIVVIQPLV